MTITTTLFVVALLMILAGLGIVYLSKNAGPTLSNLFRWVGIVVAVLGLIIILIPILTYIQRQLVAALGIQ